MMQRDGGDIGAAVRSGSNSTYLVLFQWYRVQGASLRKEKSRLDQIMRHSVHDCFFYDRICKLAI